MLDFFRVNKSFFNLVEESSEGSGFRNCQVGAVWAVRSHFTVSQDHALVNMPTGSGKTAVMIALAFELSARRVFVLTPSQLIRDQTASKFESLKLLEDIGALTSDQRPKVKQVRKRLSSPDTWQELLDYDVVVATPQTASPTVRASGAVVRPSEQVSVVQPPVSFFGGDTPEFDVVFIDEAHHSPAKTWASFLNQVQGAKVIYLTATPFRRDRKRIRARPVYFYPISKAIDDGIYRAVKFVAVHNADRDRRDSLMAEKSYTLLQELKKRDPDAAVIVKAEDIDHAKRLLTVYRDNGWDKIDIIHSRRTLGANKKVIDRVHSERNKEEGCQPLDGFISVAMGGEGLDIPNLRLAVFHRAPQTLPYTVQLIGRVSRMGGGDASDAILIADPEVARGKEVQELYKSDLGWSQMLPRLFRRYTRTSRFLHRRESWDSRIPPLLKEDLLPYLSVRVYQGKDGSRIRELSPAVKLRSLETSDLDVETLDWKPDSAIVVTKTVEQPRWTTDTSLETDKFDLHMFYVLGSLLFEFTSSERVCALVRSGVHDFDKLDRLGDDLLRNALSDAVGAHYFMLGLRNQSGMVAGLPDYKVFLGENVETAIKHSDGRNYGTGHAVMKKGNETRGIALSSSRVWSSKRCSVGEFHQWCDKVGKLISQLASQPIPLIEDLLMVHKVISAYDTNLEPISILASDAVLLSEKVEVTVDGDVLNDPILIFEGKKVNAERNAIDTDLHLVDSTTDKLWKSLPLRHSLVPPFWQLRSRHDVVVEVESGPGQPLYGGELKDVLRDLPPRILLSSGATVIENIIYSPRIQDQPLDERLLEVKDWTGTDLKKEATKPRPGFTHNVLQKTAEIIEQEYSLDPDEDLLVCDDRANEIADFVLIEQGAAKISFFHCKFKKSERKRPGTARVDISELVDQGVRTGHWIRAAGLIKRLCTRVAGNSEVVVGSELELERLATRFYPTQWDYEVVVVQPGLSKSGLIGAKRRRQAEELLVVLKDRTLDLGAGFKVWCSP